MTSGDYVWSPEKGYFEPNTEGLSTEEVQERNKECQLASESFSLGKRAGAMGRSMDSLADIFTEVDVDCEIAADRDEIAIRLGESLAGEQADFLHLEFADVPDEYQYTLFDPNYSRSSV